MLPETEGRKEKLRTFSDLIVGQQKSFLGVFEVWKRGTAQPLSACWTTFPLLLLVGGGLFIQQSTKSLSPPPFKTHSSLSLALSRSFSLSQSHCISLSPSLSLHAPVSTLRNQAQIFGAVQYLSSLLCREADMPIHPQTYTRSRRKNVRDPRPVQAAQCWWWTEAGLPPTSRSPSLGQNNNERPGPRLNRNRTE